MKKLTFVFLIAVLRSCPVHAPAPTEIPISKRIQSLKDNIKADINRYQRPDYGGVSYDGDVSEESFGKLRDFTIEPIVTRQDRHRHKHHRPIAAFNLTVGNIKVKKKTTTNKDHKQKGQLRMDLKSLKSTTKSRLYMINPLDIFYRRSLDSDCEWKWTHCQDIITPFLTGLKKEPVVLKKITAKDPIVKRLFYLLNLNTTDLTKEDVYSVLYQISKLKIRLFQWDIVSIRLLMNILIKGTHTFSNLKRGIKNLFATWRLTLSNTTSILMNTRIVRPPCVVTSRYSGSTKSQKVSRVKDWTTKMTTSCMDRDGLCDVSIL